MTRISFEIEPGVTVNAKTIESLDDGSLRVETDEGDIMTLSPGTDAFTSIKTFDAPKDPKEKHVPEKPPNLNFGKSNKTKVDIQPAPDSTESAEEEEEEDKSWDGDTVMKVCIFGLAAIIFYNR